MGTVGAPPAQRSSRYGDEGLQVDLALVFGLSLTGLTLLVGWIDNPQALTSNGIFKALTIRTWMADPAGASLDASNYLYYPVMARLCQLLDLLGILAGDPRRQIAYINCFFAAISLCLVYILVRRLFASRLVAWAAVLFHLASAFFLNLAVSNEDILPSYTLLLASMVLACLWFDRPTLFRIAAVCFVFTLAWLSEWRLMFPTLPALLVALLVGPGTLWRRIGRAAFFVVLMVGFAELAMLLWGPQEGNAGSVADLLWTGKGYDTGWGGFAARKLLLMWAGVTQYLVGGTNFGDVSYLPSIIREMVFASALIGFAALAALILLARNIHDVRLRVTAAVFGITFLAGEFLNLYSQPQDPQMQINVMIWLTVAVAAILAAIPRPVRSVASLLVAGLSCALLYYNANRTEAVRGADSAWRGALERIGRQVDPARTVFLFHGFEQVMSEMFYEWRGDWTYFPRLGPAPSPLPKFKFIALVNAPIHHPGDDSIQTADRLAGEIDRALDLGYEVVADYVWEMSEPAFVAYMSTVCDAPKAKAIYSMLHRRFTATPLFDDPVAKKFYRIQRNADGRQ